MPNPRGNPNLKPPKEAQWKKGQTGNPGGKSKAQIELERKVKAGNVEISLFIMKCLNMTKDELIEIIQNPKATMFEITLGKLVAKASTGDMQSLAYMLDRTYGKPKEMAEVLPPPDPNKLPTYIVELDGRGKFMSSTPKLIGEKVIEVETVKEES